MKLLRAMDTSFRLEQAIKKLYLAFHNDELHPECCKRCAVGNILDQTDSWKHLSDAHGATQLNYIGTVHQNLGRRFNGYTPIELLEIEYRFLKACGYILPYSRKNKNPKNIKDKVVLFNGLSAVIAYLCELDGIADVMNYTKIFDYERKTITTVYQV